MMAPAKPRDSDTPAGLPAGQAETGERPDLLAAPTLASAPACANELTAMADSLVLFFPPGGAQPSGDDMTFVRRFADKVASCPGARIVVEGHSDATGQDDVNIMLSWERAENVVSALAASGYATAQFTAVGYGSRFPLAEGDIDNEELSQNRRVQFRLRAE